MRKIKRYKRLIRVVITLHLLYFSLLGSVFAENMGNPKLTAKARGRKRGRF